MNRPYNRQCRSATGRACPRVCRRDRWFPEAENPAVAGRGDACVALTTVGPASHVGSTVARHPVLMGHDHQVRFALTMGGLHHRRSLRLRGYDYAAPGAYFVTVCAQKRACLFGEIVDNQMHSNGAGAIVAEAGAAIPAGHEGVTVDMFVVMPNHIHAIIVIGPNVGAIHESPLQPPPHRSITFRRRMLIPRVVGRFKMLSAKRINAMRGTAGRPVWQRNYYERIIRDESELNRTRQYVAENPQHWFEDVENPVVARRGDACVAPTAGPIAPISGPGLG